MQLIPAPLRSKSYLNLKSLRFWRFTVLSLITICVIFLSQFHFSPIQAREVAANNWGYATFPVESFVAYTSPFGYRRSPTTGEQSFHRGLDIAGPEGSYIRNWWSGRVVDVSDHTACGTMIVMQSGDWQHIYCHLVGRVETNGSSRYIVDREGGIMIAVGQEIPTGARIGRIGMTGQTTGPHLHWGLKHGNNYVDPGEVIRAMHQQNLATS